MKPTIHDVVKLSGVSYVTVSRVLRGEKSVRENKRRLVVEAAKALGYSPNAAARTLVMGKTNVIALIINDLKDDYFTSLIKSIGENLRERGYLLSLISEEEMTGSWSQKWMTGRVDGVIVLSPEAEETMVLQLAARGMPFVVLDSQDVKQKYPSILTNNKRGGEIAIEYLASIGCKSVGLLGANLEFYSSLQRRLGALEAIDRLGLDLAFEYYDEYSQLTGYEGIQQFRQMIASGEMGVFAFDDNIALGAINALKDMGFKVPRDISVCGYDDSRLGNEYNPSITSIKQPYEEMAQIATEAILKAIEEDENFLVTRSVDPILVVKASTK